MKPLRPGDKIARFEIKKELGRGEFGSAYLADDFLGSSVVVCIFDTRTRPHAIDQSFRRLLIVDSHVASCRGLYRLDNDWFALETELVSGLSLRRFLETTQPIPESETLRIAHELIRGLASVHEAGVIHRDLKPENVLLGEGRRVTILDLGLHVAGLPQPPLEGTPSYVAPEIARGEEPTPASDVYSLGAILRDLRRSTEYRAAKSDPQSAFVALPFDELVEWCLASDPAERPTDAGEVSARLPLLTQGMPPSGDASGLPDWTKLALENRELAASLMDMEWLGADALLLLSEPLESTDVADKLDVAEADVNQVLASMHEAGLVERPSEKSWRRTPLGERHAARLDELCQGAA